MRRIQKQSLALALVGLLVSSPASLDLAWAGKGQSNTSTSVASTSTTSAEVDGTLGGVVRSGRWTVVVPPGAFSGVGTITMSVPDRNTFLCGLDIKPGSLNNFLVPVELSFSTQGLSIDPTTLTIYWYDSANKKWVDVHGVGDSGKQLVAVLLSHFSTYGAGKAGW